MTEITRVLAGIDTSENAVRAADWAAALAAELGAHLTVAHALDLPDDHLVPPEHSPYVDRRHREGEQILFRATRRIGERHPGLNITAELSEHDPARALADLALDADLLVTGTRGHGGFTGMLLGSVSNKLAAHAPCPVVVVGADEPVDSRLELVLGLAAGEAAEPIEFAFRLADRLGLTVHAVRAFEPVIVLGGYYEQTLPAVAEDLEALLKPARHRYPDVPVTVEPWQGAAVPALVQAGRGALLTVVGSHRRRGPLSFGPGHVVHGLLSHSATPVAVVPIG